MADEYADLKQMLQQQLKLMEALTVKLSNSSMGQSSAAGGSQSVDHIAGSITEFFMTLVHNNHLTRILTNNNDGGGRQESQLAQMDLPPQHEC
ncbi:hypothetical protein SprV_0401611600 [Sparganum proliferum]